MDKRIATNIVKMLDGVAITGHQDRQAMNEGCEALLAIINASTAEPKAEVPVEDFVDANAE